jgi:hypothetical protein
MDHFAGLDVSVKETSICVLDDTGRIMKEVRWRASLKPIAMAFQWACGSRLARRLC